jgi:Leucine-rich repeat (LRR) protein
MCKTAIAALKEKGFSIKIDGAGKVWYVFASDIKLIPADIENLGAFRGIRDLYLSGCAHDDSIWPLLASMPDLEELTLTAGFANETKGPADIEYPGLEDPPVWLWGVSDAGSEFLRFVPKLKSLNLSRTHIGDTTLAHIGGLQSLEKLQLVDTQITSAGLTHLHDLHTLEQLSVIGTAVDDGGLRNISELASLKTLELESTKISNSGLVHVGKLASLEELSLHSTDVTEEGLVHLLPLKRLKTLYIGNPITSIGLRCLKELPALFVVYIGDSNKGRYMSESEIDFVKSELPNAIVEY